MYLLYQTPEDGRKIIGTLMPEIKNYNRNIRLIYGEDCEFTIKGLINDIDEYSISHFFGWIGITLIARNLPLVLIW